MKFPFPPNLPNPGPSNSRLSKPEESLVKILGTIVLTLGHEITKLGEYERLQARKAKYDEQLPAAGDLSTQDGLAAAQEKFASLPPHEQQCQIHDAQRAAEAQQRIMDVEEQSIFFSPRGAANRYRKLYQAVNGTGRGG